MIKKGVQNSAYVHNYVNIDFGQDVGGMSEKDPLKTDLPQQKRDLN